MATALPTILVVDGLKKSYAALTERLRAYDGGRLEREFNFEHVDCYSSLKDWYARNHGRFVALVIQNIDYSDVKDENKLAGYPEFKHVIPMDFDQQAFQGFVIYALMRQNDVDPIVPVLFVLSPAALLKAQRFASFIIYPGQGVCSFVPVEDNSADGDAVAERADAIALRPLSDTEREHWRTRHRMVIGQSRKMVALAREIERVGLGDSVVLMLGKPGVGKELVANALHRCSHRYVADDPDRDLPHTVNIASLDHSLLQDELFGHVRGAFTGAVADRSGIFEASRGSTVFLDEIGDVGTDVQLKLLRVIENKRVRRLGSSTEVQVEMRIIAATNCTIEDLQMSFRPDFYSRIVQQCISIPSLRARWLGEDPVVVEQDLHEMFRFIVDELNANPRNDRRLEIDRTAIKFLHQLVSEYVAGTNDVLQGNMRTLRSTLEQSYERARHDGSQAISIGHIISTVGFLQFTNRRQPDEVKRTLEDLVGSLNIRDVEKRAIVEALTRCDNNQSRAAELLGIHRDTLRRKIADYSI